MALDADTITRLQALQADLQAQHDRTQASIDYVQGVEAAVEAAGLTTRELLATKEAVFADLPDEDALNGELAKLNDALSAIQKLLSLS